MTIIVTPQLATSQAALPGSGANRNDNDAGGFGEVLNRSLARPEAEGAQAGKPANAAAPAGRRRDAGKKAGAADAADASGVAALASVALQAPQAPPVRAVSSEAGGVAGGAVAAPAQNLLANGAPADARGRPDTLRPEADDTAAQQALPAGDTAAPDALAGTPDASSVATQARQAGATPLQATPSRDGELRRASAAPDLPQPAAANGQAAAGGPVAAAGHSGGAGDGQAFRQDERDGAAAAASRPGTGATPDGLASSAMLFDAAAASPSSIHDAAPVAAGSAEAAQPLQLSLEPPVGSSAWNDALGRGMMWLNRSGKDVAELHLNPPGLGPLKVTLTVSDQQAQALFLSPHQSVRAAVEAALPHLRTSLAENGISLGNASVGADTAQQQSAFAQQQPGQSGQSGGSGRQPAQADRLADPAMHIGTAAGAAVPRRNAGAVDTFA